VSRTAGRLIACADARDRVPLRARRAKGCIVPLEME
jgi:hypothetical protein